MLLRSKLQFDWLKIPICYCRAKEELTVARQQHSDHVKQISEDHVSHQLQIQSLSEASEQLRTQLVSRQQEIEKYVTGIFYGHNQRRLEAFT